MVNLKVEYSTVNEILDKLLNSISAVLDNQLVGMYLHGSLALNDFQPKRSDIDIIVATKEDLSVSLIEKLKSMHKNISQSNLPYAKNFECKYVPLNSLKNYSQQDTFPCLFVGGDFGNDGFGLIERHVLREHGITVQGPSLKSYMKPVSPKELKEAAYSSLLNWWKPKLIDSSKLREDDYQVYAVLTMCRALYTLENGDIASKSKAASYAKNKLDKRWRVLIDKALSWKEGNDFNELEETLEFIKHTLKTVGI